MVDVKEFDVWGSFYDPDNLELKQLLSLCDFKGKTILEIGCGTVRVTSKLQGFSRLVAIDSNRDMMPLCATKSNRAELAIADASYLPFKDGSFDIVLSTWCISGLPNVGRMMWDIFRVMKSGGTFIAIDASAHGDYDTMTNAFRPGYLKQLHADVEELRRHMKRYFTTVNDVRLLVPYVFPDIATAKKYVLYGLKEWHKVKVDEPRLMELLKKFEVGEKL